MFAIIQKDGRQYRVSKGDTIRFDRIKSKPGESFETEEVLLIEGKDGKHKIGTPTVIGAKVSGKIISHGKDKKIVVFKRKRRKTYRRKYGHRQLHTMVKIESISSEIISEKTKSTKNVSKKSVSRKNVPKESDSTKVSAKKIDPTKKTAKTISKSKVSVNKIKD